MDRPRADAGDARTFDLVAVSVPTDAWDTADPVRDKLGAVDAVARRLAEHPEAARAIGLPPPASPASEPIRSVGRRWGYGS